MVLLKALVKQTLLLLYLLLFLISFLTVGQLL